MEKDEKGWKRMKKGEDKMIVNDIHNKKYETILAISCLAIRSAIKNISSSKDEVFGAKIAQKRRRY